MSQENRMSSDELRKLLESHKEVMEASGRSRYNELIWGDRLHDEAIAELLQVSTDLGLTVADVASDRLETAKYLALLQIGGDFEAAAVAFEQMTVVDYQVRRRRDVAAQAIRDAVALRRKRKHLFAARPSLAEDLAAELDRRALSAGQPQEVIAA